MMGRDTRSKVQSAYSHDTLYAYAVALVLTSPD